MEQRRTFRYFAKPDDTFDLEIFFFFQFRNFMFVKLLMFVFVCVQS